MCIWLVFIQFYHWWCTEPWTWSLIETCLCSWWLQYRNLQVIFKMSPRQSPDIYWHAELCSRRLCSVQNGPHSECILWWSSSNHQLCSTVIFKCSETFLSPYIYTICFVSLCTVKCRGHAELLKVVDPGRLILCVAGRVIHYDYNRVWPERHKQKPCLSSSPND
jgi:hypothetical protein